MSAPNGSCRSQTAFLALTLFLIVTWGSAFTLVGVGVKYMSPMWLVAYRLIIGAIFMIGYVVMTGAKFPKLTDSRWLWYFGLGLTGMTLPFIFIATGQVNVDSGLAAIIVGAMPIMTIILAHFFAHEHLTLMKSIGFFIGFLGIVILFLPEDFSLDLVSDWQAQMLILFGAFFYAVTTVAAKRAPKTPSAVGAAMMLIGAAIVGVIGALFTGLPTGLPEMPGILAAIGLGLGSTAIATIVYLYIIDQKGPSVLAKINYFVPVASVFFGVWLLNEPFTWRMVVSFIVILVGIIVAKIGTPKAALPTNP